MSAAYYALFHLLIADAARILTPRSPAGLRSLVQRAFGHAEMKGACKGFIRADIAIRRNQQTGELPPSTQTVLSFPLEPALVEVMNAFVDLQEARHKADYDLSDQWNRVDVLNKLKMAESAFAKWEQVRDQSNAMVLMSAFLLQRQWGR